MTTNAHSANRINKHDIHFLLDAPDQNSKHTRKSSVSHHARYLPVSHPPRMTGREIAPTFLHPSQTVSHQVGQETRSLRQITTSSGWNSSTTLPRGLQTNSTSRPVPSPSLGPHQCRECTMTFSSQQQLSNHVRAVHRLKPYACKLCDKTFAERGNANKHYRVAHLKQRNHRCVTCDRTFAFRDGLNRHISMVHLNERPFECTECMCPSGPHSPDIPCSHICGMRFKQKSHRRRHVLSVHHAAAARHSGDMQQTTPFASLPHFRLSNQRSQHVSWPF